MNFLFVTVAVALVAQAYSQCIPPCSTGLSPIYSPGCSCGCNPSVVASPLVAPNAVVAPAVIQPNSVAASLADTLSLLTVSTLLAEKLPYGCPLPAAPFYPGCGCGYGYVI